VGVALEGLGEIDVHLVRQGGHPCDDVCELVQLLINAALADGLGELADLLAKPRHRRRGPSGSVPMTEGPVDDVLQLGEIHASILHDRV